VTATVIKMDCLPMICNEVNFDETCKLILGDLAPAGATCGVSCVIATDCVQSGKSRRSAAVDLDIVVAYPTNATMVVNDSAPLTLVGSDGGKMVVPVTGTSTTTFAVPTSGRMRTSDLLVLINQRVGVTATELATMYQGEQTSCYIALLDGDCSDADVYGGVYFIESAWYNIHSGGTNAIERNCGKFIENWIGKSGGHPYYAEALKQDSNFEDRATYFSEFVCPPPPTQSTNATTPPTVLPATTQGEGRATTEAPVPNATVLAESTVAAATSTLGGGAIGGIVIAILVVLVLLIFVRLKAKKKSTNAVVPSESNVADDNEGARSPPATKEGWGEDKKCDPFPPLSLPALNLKSMTMGSAMSLEAL
jgi:hypothetical protein